MNLVVAERLEACLLLGQGDGLLAAEQFQAIKIALLVGMRLQEGARGEAALKVSEAVEGRPSSGMLGANRAPGLLARKMRGLVGQDVGGALQARQLERLASNMLPISWWCKLACPALLETCREPTDLSCLPVLPREQT